MSPARTACLRACALLLVCACARAEPPAPHTKRAESEFMSPMPFVLGSRYGRSEQRLIAPRNDRFFMGSRYGKRSEPRLGLAPLLPLPPHALLCEPTPLASLYRCSPHTTLTSRRLEDDRETLTSQMSEDE